MVSPAVPAATDGDVVTLDVTGMTCASCVARVEKVLRKHPGVTDAAVNLATGRATVTLDLGADAARAEADALAERLTRAGYESHPHRQMSASATAAAEASGHEQDSEQALHRLVWATCLALPVFLLEMGGHLVPAWHHWLMATLGQGTLWWIQMVLTTAVIVGPGRPFFTLGFKALRHAAPDMNTLVAVGALAAWSYSMVALLLPGVLPAGTVHVYFEAAAVIITLILLGRWLEGRARARTTDAISRLASLQPSMARVERDGQYQQVPIASIVPGERVQIRPGERVPVDGQVIEGESHVDESMLTGESVPVRRGPGDALATGTLNQGGGLTMRVTHAVGDTVLDRIMAMVEAAQGSKMPIQALIDQVALWFVPIVMGLAVVTFGAWLAFGPEPALNLAIVNAVAVLIIACPCAMGLATPVSVMVGIGRAATLGLLFRQGSALQALDGVRVVAFDKTGTLTQGRPSLQQILPVGDYSQDALLASVASVEERSEHPIGQAIVAAAQARGLHLPVATGFAAAAGHGARATVEGQAVLVGSRAFMQREGIATIDLDPLADPLADQGHSLVYVAIDRRAAGVLSVADGLKDDAHATVARLRADGLAVAMITGDNERTAQAIGRELGITDIHAQCLPEDKLALLRQLRERHGPVASSGMASTMHRPWPAPMSESRSAREPMSRWPPPMSS
ncbi:MAG: heavy metal translocating P-type ATPase [Burkholderiaceae bacterium]